MQKHTVEITYRCLEIAWRCLVNPVAMPRDHMAMPSEPKAICICIIWRSICIHIEIYMYARSHMNMYMHISYVHVYMYESVMPCYVQVLSSRVLSDPSRPWLNQPNK